MADPKDEALIKELGKQQDNLTQEMADLIVNINRLKKEIENQGDINGELTKTLVSGQDEQKRIFDEREQVITKREEINKKSTDDLQKSNEALQKSNEQLSKISVAGGKIWGGLEKRLMGFQDVVGGMAGLFDKSPLALFGGLLGMGRKGLTGKSRIGEFFMDDKTKAGLIEERKKDLSKDRFSEEERRSKMGTFELFGTKMANLLTFGVASGARVKDEEVVEKVDEVPSLSSETPSSATLDSLEEASTESLDSSDSLTGIYTFTEKIFGLMSAGKQFAEENQTEERRWKESLLKALQNIGGGGGEVPDAKPAGGFFSKLFGGLFGGLLGGVAAFSLPLLLRGLRKTVDGIFRVGTTFIRGIGSIIREIFNLFKTAVVGIGEVVQSIIDSIMRFAGEGIKAFIMTLGSIPLPMLGLAAIAIGAISVQMLALGKALEMAAPFITSVFTGLSKFVKAVGDSVAKVLDPMTNSLIRLSKIPFLSLLKLGVFFSQFGFSLLAFAGTASFAIPALLALAKASKGLTDLLDRADLIIKFREGMVSLTKSIKSFSKEVLRGGLSDALDLINSMDDSPILHKFLDIQLKQSGMKLQTAQNAGELLQLSREIVLSKEGKEDLINSIITTQTNNTNVANSVTNFNDNGIRQTTILAPPGVAD